MADAHREPLADEHLSLLPLPIHRLLLLVCGLILVAADLARLTGWWPCDIACQGGAHYQTLAGVSIVWPALVAHLLLAWWAGRDLRRGTTNPWTVRLVLWLTGSTLFFHLIARELALSCPYCQLVHLLTMVALLLIIPMATRWRESLLLPLAGWLIMNALFHHQAVADVAAPGHGPGQSATATSPVSAAADRGRTYGVASARRTLEIVIDLTCSHCAEQYRPVMDALKPAIAAKRVQVVIRHLVRPSQPASQHASELALAAAAIGEHATAMEVLLGSNPDAGFAGLKARLAEVVDPTKLDGVLTRDAAAISALIADDQQRIAQLGMGPRTPAAALSEDGKVVKRWSGDLPLADLVASLDDGL